MDRKLSFFGVAVMYVGVIMGAGFASGRECFQFFGIFGNAGYKGILLTSIGFMLVALMLNYIALSKQSLQLDEIVSPVDNKLISNIIGWTLGIIYYSMLIAMSSAGGSLLKQAFGLPNYIGGFIITALTLATVLGDFNRVAKIFKKFVPILFVICLSTISLLIFLSPAAPKGENFSPSEMAPTWQISSLLFLSYNSLGMITMAGSSAVNAKSRKEAFIGSIIGIGLLCFLTLSLLAVLLKGPGFSSSLELPMVGWASLINPKFGYLYSLVLFGAIYQTSSSTYYGFSTCLKDSKSKKYYLCIGALLGFVAGLTDFKRIVAILYPAQGYIGFLILILIIINFIKEMRKNKEE